MGYLKRRSKQEAVSRPKTAKAKVENATPENLPDLEPLEPAVPTSATIRRAKENPRSLSHSEVIQLQQTIGNQAVTRLLLASNNKTDRLASVQRLHMVASDPDTVLANPELYPGRDLKWKAKLDEIYAHIAEVRKVLEDDDDVNFLKAWEGRIDTLAEEADRLTTQFALAPAFREGRPKRKAGGGGSSVKNSSGKRGRSEEEETPVKKVRTKEPEEVSVQTKGEIADLIHAKTIELGKQYVALKAIFTLNEGGFSAKARAHDMGEKEEETDDHEAVATWFENIKVGDQFLNEVKKVYKQYKKKTEEAGKPTVEGVVTSGLTEAKKTKKLRTIEGKITELTLTHAPTPFKRAPLSADRGAGQLANMANTNASGYAMLSGVSGWDTTRWEWLHIRAASLGGATDGSNLVVGTRDANTQMMPFEANVRLLAKVVSENKNYKELKVEFKATDQHSVAKHKVNQISIKWELVKADDAKPGTKGASGEAKFNPLNTDASISKTEVAILEQTLKEKREEIKGGA